MNKRGYFGIGIENGKDEKNIGTLWRSAFSFGASFIFTIGNRYKHQFTDTTKSIRHIPLYEYKDLNHFIDAVPKYCKIIGLEFDNKSIDLKSFYHPKRCIYLLGAEDIGLSNGAKNICNSIIHIKTKYCLNVSTTGSIVMYDRQIKI